MEVTSTGANVDGHVLVCTVRYIINIYISGVSFEVSVSQEWPGISEFIYSQMRIKRTEPQVRRSREAKNGYIKISVSRCRTSNERTSTGRSLVEKIVRISGAR